MPGGRRGGVRISRLRCSCPPRRHPGRQQRVWLSVRMHLPADTAIVGRDRERAELATVLTSTRAGYGRAVLLLGEAGMGKSMLADWLVSQAEQAGVQVARAAG